MSTAQKEFPITTPKKRFLTLEQKEQQKEQQQQQQQQQKGTIKNSSLYPLITYATKSPTEKKRRECNYYKLPLKVRSVIASEGSRNCKHVNQYSIGVYEIRLENGNSIIVNTHSGYGSGIKTRRRKNKNKNKKNKSRRSR